MAYLRDSKTSEIVFEGTPLECVLAAKELGGGAIAPQLAEGTEEHGIAAEVFYDDVGLGFKPDEVLKAHEENVQGLAGAASEAKGREAKQLAKAHEEAKAAGELDRDSLRKAEAALEQARALQDEALGG